MRLLVSSTCLVLSLTACSSLPDSYAQSPSWSRYPPELREDDDDPALREVWWEFDGHTVHLDHWTPPNAATGRVILVHGGGGHGRLLAGYAAPLVARGFEVIAPDLPHFGLTKVHVDAPVTLSTWIDLVSELASWGEPTGPVVVVGLSLGGTVALHAAAATPAIQGVVATTLLDVSDLETLRAVSSSARRVDMLDGLDGRLGWVRIRAGALAPLDKMSGRRDVVAALRRDPLIGRRRVPLSLYQSFLDTPLPRALAQLDVPVVWAHPQADRWTLEEHSHATYAQLGSQRRKVVLGNAEHLPLEAPGKGQLVDEILALLEELGGERGSAYSPDAGEEAGGG